MCLWIAGSYAASWWWMLRELVPRTRPIWVWAKRVWLGLCPRPALHWRVAEELRLACRQRLHPEQHRMPLGLQRLPGPSADRRSGLPAIGKLMSELQVAARPQCATRPAARVVPPTDATGILAGTHPANLRGRQSGRPRVDARYRGSRLWHAATDSRSELNAKSNYAVSGCYHR